MLGPLKNRSFAALVASQFLGAFNDNAFKQLVLLMTVAAATANGLPWVVDSGVALGADGAARQWIPATLFALPFVLLCTATGALADRVSKTGVIRAANAVEIAVMGLALVALWLESYVGLLGIVFLMGAQSALFGPSKYGIVRELVDDRDMSRANAVIQTTTTIAILGGVVLAGSLAKHFREALWVPGLVFIALSALGLAACLPIERQPARDPGRRIPVNFVADMLRRSRAVSGTPHLGASIVGSAVFYFVGALMLLVVNEYGLLTLGLDEEQTSKMLLPVVLGIAVGAVVASRLSGDRIEGGIVPLGLLGMAVSLLAIRVAPTSTWWVAVCLSGLGVSSGVFSLPIRTLVQVLPPDDSRGSVLGFSQGMDFIGILLAGPAMALMQAGGLSPDWMVVAVAAFLLVAFLVSLRFAAHFTVRFVIWALAHTVYRVKVRHAGRIPERGGALLVANHQSFVDAVIIAAVSGRPVRFLMFRGFFDVPLLGWFARKMGAIPVSRSDARVDKDAALARAAELARDGELVCIFAEGAITRTGHVMPFATGMERIARAAGVPIVPVALDRLWGSIFSYHGGKVFTKLPRRFPYKVDLAVGEALSSDATAFEARQRIQALIADIRRERRGRRGSLAWRLLREARRNARQPAIVDGAVGVSLDFRRLSVGALSMRDTLEPMLTDAPNVAVLLPPGAGGALANLALALGGRTSVNLNYTLENSDLADMCERAGCDRIITARRFLDALERESPLPAERTILLEDVRPMIRTSAKLLHLAASFLPGGLYADIGAPRVPVGRIASDEVATVIFSSGSTGRPKGVELTHGNILSNVQSVLQVVSLGPGDAVLGVLPFFHSFGYTVTIWATLLGGARAVYHANPLEAKRIGALCREHGVTFTIATPTFYASYLRRCAPEDFARVRVALSGAQKLSQGLADAWEGRFGSKLMEGYGCTELSPVVSANLPSSPDAPRRMRTSRVGSVGRPLPGIAIRVVDPDAYPGEVRERGAGEPGLIVVRGPNVMRGYLGEPERTAEVLIDDWYTTGDIGYLDEDGFLFLTDRLSRFSKIGGEMVPHGRVEEVLIDLSFDLARESGAAPAASDVDEDAVPEIAVTAVEDEVKGEQLVVLHAGLPFDVEDLKARLAETDLPRLFLPRRDAWFEVREIPKLGTGKTDLGGVRRLAQERVAAASVR